MGNDPVPDSLSPPANSRRPRPFNAKRKESARLSSSEAGNAEKHGAPIRGKRGARAGMFCSHRSVGWFNIDNLVLVWVCAIMSYRNEISGLESASMKYMKLFAAVRSRMVHGLDPNIINFSCIM